MKWIKERREERLRTDARRAFEILEERGWGAGVPVNPITGEVCLLGAVTMAVGMEPSSLIQGTGPKSHRARRLVERVLDVAGVKWESRSLCYTAYTWNDRVNAYQGFPSLRKPEERDNRPVHTALQKIALNPEIEESAPQILDKPTQPCYIDQSLATQLKATNAVRATNQLVSPG